MLCGTRSRNSENNTNKYPDITASVPRLLKPGVRSVVLDCEAVAFDRTEGKILPFQARPLQPPPASASLKVVCNEW